MILKVGSRGEDVKKLQAKLGLGADGIFGKGTEDAVKSFQTKNGLSPDGIVGENTWKRIMGESTLITEPAPVPSDTPLKLAHFLAQCGHESGGFRVVSENLNYSAQGLKNIFPKYFPGNLSESYARNPQKIANKVYGGRMGNGAESSGEGYKFRGRGYIQLTGKDNYTAFGKAINEDIVSNPDLVSTKYPLLSAAWFFSKNCLRRVTDESNATVTNVTKCVNGGTIGLPDRLKHFKEYYHLLS